MNSPYIISEAQDINSVREGFKFEGDLKAARRKASDEQCFHGTVMKIETVQRELVAYKKNGRWYNA